MQKDNYYNYWGKADKDDAGKVIWHPLAYHMLDVAAVAESFIACRLPVVRLLATVRLLLVRT